MGITINVNQISEEITKCREECFNLCLNGTIISPEPIKSKLKQIFLSNKMNDSNVALISVAIDGQSLNGKPLSVYSTTMSSFVESYSKKIFESAKNELAERRGEEKQAPENTPAKRKIPNAEFLLLDIKKLSDIGKASPTALKGATSKFLSQNAIENVIITNENMKNYDFSAFGVEPTPGMTIGECLLECSKNHISSTSSKQAQKSEEKSSKDDVLATLEEKDNGNINYFVGYNKQEVSKLFKNKEDLVKKFACFVEMYNYLMNLFVNHNLDKDLAKDIHNDILPFYFTMATACSSYGGEGSQIKNLCDGMMNILDDAFKAEMNGENLNPTQTKQNIEKMGISTKDDDGITNDCISLSDTPNASQMFDDGGSVKNGISAVRKAVDIQLEAEYCMSADMIDSTIQELRERGQIPGEAARRKDS